MTFEDTEIDGLKILHFNVFSDNRGKLIKPWNVHELESIIGKNVETYVTHTVSKTLRGLHYQINQGIQKKLVVCLNGKIDDLIVDLNEKSKSFGKSVRINLEGMDGLGVLVPELCAHGTYSYVDSIYQVISNNIYMPEFEKGILWSSVDNFKSLM